MLVYMYVYVHVIEHDMLTKMYTCTVKDHHPLTFKSVYELLETMGEEHELLETIGEEHELMVTVVVATMYGDVVTIGADDVYELLGFAKVKSIL